MRSGGFAKCQLFSQVANSVDETDNSNLLPRSHSVSLGRERAGYEINSKNRGIEVECMLCYNTISLVCFCLQFARYNEKDICEVARALNCPEEDR